MVTAFAHGARLSLGIIESAKGGGEILALRELIKMLDIKGMTITADALHCQRETCELIVREGGDYCVQLKGNQGDMQADVRAFIDDQETDYIENISQLTPTMAALKSDVTMSTALRNILTTHTNGQASRPSSMSLQHVK